MKLGTSLTMTYQNLINKYMPVINYTPPEAICTSPEHDMPSMQVLAPGTYTWKCPQCGKEKIIKIPLITC